MDLADIQGNVLRGFRFPHARHFALAFGEPAQARQLLSNLLPENADGGLRVTDADDWLDKPARCINVGLTFQGLQALGLPAPVLGAFPKVFQDGPAKRADPTDPDFGRGVGLGDVGDSAPEHWSVGGPANDPVHLLLSLYARSRKHLEEASKKLRGDYAGHGVTEVSHHDADALPKGRVHFGYRDGIGQPRISESDGTGRQLADMQPEVDTGDFLLGKDYTNVYAGNYLGDLPAALGDNGTYNAFRILRQDVAAFEQLLDRWAEAARMDRELVAAKLMGRWRNGVPLTLSPKTADPQPPIPEKAINEFDYAPGPAHTTFYDDDEGLRCPIGSHIRRLNPRGALVMGMPHSRRLIRRGMPYGPEFDPDTHPDGKERGIIGNFICGDLEYQYEFIQRVWANQDFATTGLRGSREPLIGAQPDGGGSFTIRTADARDPIVLGGLPTLVDTRGSLYTFMPGIGGLRYLATGSAAP